MENALQSNGPGTAASTNNRPARADIRHSNVGAQGHAPASQGPGARLVGKRTVGWPGQSNV